MAVPQCVEKRGTLGAPKRQQPFLLIGLALLMWGTLSSCGIMGSTSRFDEHSKSLKGG